MSLICGLTLISLICGLISLIGGVICQISIISGLTSLTSGQLGSLISLIGNLVNLALQEITDSSKNCFCYFLLKIYNMFDVSRTHVLLPVAFHICVPYIYPMLLSHIVVPSFFCMFFFPMSLPHSSILGRYSRICGKYTGI